MKAKILSSPLLCLLLFGCGGETHHDKNDTTQVKSPKSTQSIGTKQHVGAWRPVAEEEQAGLHAAAKTVAKTVSQGKSEQFLEISDAMQQTVAGTNYKFTITLPKQGKWYALVYRNPEGVYIVAQLKPVQKRKKQTQ